MKLESLNDAKFQQLDSNEMAAINGGGWKVTSISYSTTPDNMELVTHVVLEKTNWLTGKLTGVEKIEQILDGQAC